MNKEEFIGKLQMVYVGDRNAFNEIVENNQKLKNEVVYSKVEINRLNNIINELEKYCNEEIIDYDKAINSKILSEIDRDRYEAEKVCFLDMLDKLKELKENNKDG